MNFKLVFHITGKVLLVEAAALLFPLLVALIYAEPIQPFLYTIFILLAVGLVLGNIPYKKHFFEREGFFAVGLIWLLMGLFGAFPFYFSGYFSSYVDCLFETFSGFTTKSSFLTISNG